MKKSFVLTLIVILFNGMVFAEPGDKSGELAKIGEYIKSLDEKIEKARAARQINKLAELKELKRKELAQAKTLKDKIGKAEKPGARSGWSNKWQARAGIGGGALIMAGGYSLQPINEFDTLVEAGLGIGKAYPILVLDARGIMPLTNTYIDYTGLELSLADSKLGLGLFMGKKVGDFDAEIGYNTTLGITVGAVYKFK